MHGFVKNVNFSGGVDNFTSVKLSTLPEAWTHSAKPNKVLWPQVFS
jgi:hypothetical protein